MGFDDGMFSEAETVRSKSIASFSAVSITNVAVVAHELSLFPGPPYVRRGCEILALKDQHPETGAVQSDYRRSESAECVTVLLS